MGNIGFGLAVGLGVTTGGGWPPLALSPASTTVVAYGGSTFTASGGTGAGYAYSISVNNSGGSINSSSGAYVAGAVGGVTDTIHAVDSIGHAAEVTVNVWSPASILSSITAWFDAEDLTTGAIASWADKSGGGNTVAQGTGALQPSRDASGLNGRGRVIFDGTKYLAKTSTPTLVQPFACLFVGKYSTASSAIVALGSAGTAPIIWLDTTGAIYAGSSLASGVAPTSAHAEYDIWNGASSFVSNNNWRAGGVTGDANTGTPAGIGLGAYTNGTFGSAGEIEEFVLFNTPLSSGDRGRLADYVAAKYGLTIT